MNRSASIITDIDGSFVNLYDQSTLRIADGATLQNVCTEVKDGGNAWGGGAICHGYLSNGSKVYMTGGRIVNCYVDTYGGAIGTCNGGHTSSTTEISGGIIENCSAGIGGGAIAMRTASHEIVINGGEIRNCSAAKGGALYLGVGTGEISDSTISGCQAEQGGAVYLDNGSDVQMSGTLSFSKNYSTSLGVDYSTAWKNGGDQSVYDGSKVRTDIFIAQYAGSNPITNIVLAGNLAAADGSVWVWCDPASTNPTHHMLGDQFAVIKDSAVVSADCFKVFRNARDDTTTGLGTNAEGYLTGTSGDDINGVKCIYWGPTTPVAGGRRVILRRVSADGNYQAVKDKTLQLRQGSSLAGAAVSGVDYQGNTATRFVSGASGIFFIGELPYGTYYVVEIESDAETPAATDPHVILTVGADGIGLKSEDGTTAQYSNELQLEVSII